LAARRPRCQGSLLRRFAEHSAIPRSPATLPVARRERSILDHVDQQQDQHDQHYQAKSTTTVVADSGAHAIAAESEQQQQDEQKNDHSEPQSKVRLDGAPIVYGSTIN
jgi:hypothetical protein